MNTSFRHGHHEYSANIDNFLYRLRDSSFKFRLPRWFKFTSNGIRLNIILHVRYHASDVSSFLNQRYPYTIFVNRHSVLTRHLVRDIGRLLNNIIESYKTRSTRLSNYHNRITNDTTKGAQSDNEAGVHEDGNMTKYHTSCLRLTLYSLRQDVTRVLVHLLIKHSRHVKRKVKYNTIRRRPKRQGGTLSRKVLNHHLNPIHMVRHSTNLLNDGQRHDTYNFVNRLCYTFRYYNIGHLDDLLQALPARNVAIGYNGQRRFIKQPRRLRRFSRRRRTRTTRRGTAPYMCKAFGCLSLTIVALQRPLARVLRRTRRNLPVGTRLTELA